MKLADQVCSLELSKALKKLGIGQETYFYWSTYIAVIDGKNTDIGFHLINAMQLFDQIEKEYCNHIYYAALTVGELGKVLPPDTGSGRMINGKYVCYMQMSEDSDTYWDNQLEETGGDIDMHLVHMDTEADARATMLIYLIENKLIVVTK